MNINVTIDKLCREYTDLVDEEIEEIQASARVLPAMARLFDADAFIDCQINDGTGDSIVVAEAKPVDNESSYRRPVVGLVATKEKEPAVYRTFNLSVNTKFMKAITQEDVMVVQTVEPIMHKNRIIGVFIIEQRMERVVIKGGSEPEIIDGSAFENVFTESDSNDDLNVADTIEEGLLFINHDNKVVFRNKVAANIYSRLGFVEDITGQDYERISLAKRIEGELANVQEVRVGSYYFSVKMITINRQDVNYIVIISDITSEKLQEKELILKSVAFKEMHHRVKNNLQTIASLIRLQQNRTTNEETKRDLADTITRILAISSTHEMLLANDMETIKLNDMINTIKDNMLKYYGNDDFKLTIENYGGDFDIPFEKASALALILNELMQNSIKYAFVGKKKGKIVLMAIDGLGDDIKLIFEDNGCGFDAQTTTGGNMGWTIINSMVNEKLNGHVKLKSGDNGTRVEIVFPSKPL